MSMETDHDPLDLLDMSDWQQDAHHQDHHIFDQDPSDAAYIDAQPLPISHPGMPIGGEMVDPQQPRSQRSSFNANLINASNDPAAMFGIKKNVIPTITTIYEPKFYEIYVSYLQYQQQFEPEINNGNASQQHLMTLCLNNLFAFSNWARDTTNGDYIRATLFENPDMRPEVRNGLAMIIVYTFSAAKAADQRNLNPSVNSDMFTVLMKTDSGMGIVNKTSLKIYSDPFGYFNFIKTCISGLIDASAIPENERVNIQQTKKTRRGSKNKDEVEAFRYVKNTIVAMLQSPDSLQLARDRINQILQFWHVKGKAIRNERFSAVFSLPPPVPSAGGGPGKTTSDDNSMVSSSPHEYHMMGRGPMTHRTSNRSSGGSLTIETANNMYNNPYASGVYNNNANNQVNDDDSINSDSISSYSRSPHPSMHESMGRGSGAMNNSRYRTGSGNNLNVSNISNNNGDDAYDVPRTSGIAALQSQNSLNIAVPALRFDRSGALKWNATNTFLYDFEALQQSTHRTAFYLVDEMKLKNYLVELMSQSNQLQPGYAESLNQGVFQLSLSYMQAASGLSSIEKLLFKSRSVVTSWSQLDFTQLKIFIDGWKSHSAHAHLKRQTSGDGNRVQRLSAQGAAIANAAAAAIQANQANNGDDMETSSVNSESFHIGSNSLDPTLNRRISRRRTTGGLEMKKDLTRLQQMQELNTSAVKSLQLNPPPQQQQPSLLQQAVSPSYVQNQPFEYSPSMRDRKSSSATNSNNNSNHNSMVVGNNAISLLDYWQTLHNPGYTPSPNSGRGLIIYERSAEVGLIVRANPKYNIHEDLWCLYYPDDAVEQFSNVLSNMGHGTNLDYSFAAFLSQLLPQTREILRVLKGENNNNQQNFGQFGGAGPQQSTAIITIGYCAHHIDAGTNPFLAVSQMGPPAAPTGSSQYRTLGNMDHPFHQILSKLSTESFFHDIILL